MAPLYQNTIFINLPVTDLSRSIAFYNAIGFVQNPAMSPKHAAMMSFPTTPSAASTSKVHDGPIKLMLHEQPSFRTFLPAGVEMADATKAVQTILCISVETEEAFEEILDKAAKSGGRRDVRPLTEAEIGAEKTAGIKGGNFTDPDGHLFSVAVMPNMFEGAVKEEGD